MDSNQAFELAGLDAIGQGELAASGEVSAAELLEAAIVRHTGTAPGDPYTAPLPKVPFLQSITQTPTAQRIVIATASPFPGPATHPEVVAAVEQTGRVLEGLGHLVEPGAPTIDADAVADAIAVLHTVSNVQLHALATQHLGREPSEDEFGPSTWVMVREGFTTSGVAYAAAIAAVHAQTRRFVAGMGEHELTDSPEAYAAELRRRWGGLLSYRYIGRSYASMDLGPEDNTVTLRRDMRNPTGGLLLAVLGIASPEGGHMSDLEAVPNPVMVEPMAGADGTVAVRTVMHDEGADERVTTVGSYLFRAE
jgi:hypothetical protein